MRWAGLQAVVLCLVVRHVSVARPAEASTPSTTGITARVLELTNTERHNVGLAPLTINPELDDAAQGYSEILARSDCFQHTCGPVPDFSLRLGLAGYTGWSAVGENIAAGYPTPEAVVAGWMQSAGHRENILSAEYTEMGVGVVTGGGQFGTYWTQEFGARPVAVARILSDEPPAGETDNGSSG